MGRHAARSFRRAPPRRRPLQKPTAAHDWRRNSDRATRWRNRFAIRIRKPAFERVRGAFAANWDKMLIGARVKTLLRQLKTHNVWKRYEIYEHGI